MIKLDPQNDRLKLDYMDSLFFLSKFKNVLSYTESHPQLKKYFDYWILRARSYFEVGQTESAIGTLKNQFVLSEDHHRAEVYYWLGQFYFAEQDYDQAILYYEKCQSESLKPGWLQNSIDNLIRSTREKNKKWRSLLKFRYGSDSNILRESEGVSDFFQYLDVSIDYDYFKKIKRSLNFGFDYNYQGYSYNSSEQTATFSPRLSQTFLVSDELSFDYMISLGKVLTNNRSDQNYFVVFSQANYKLNSDFELQTAVSLFANLNNNPVQQMAISSILSISLGSDFLWVGKAQLIWLSCEETLISMPFICNPATLRSDRLFLGIH